MNGNLNENFSGFAKNIFFPHLRKQNLGWECTCNVSKMFPFCCYIIPCFNHLAPNVGFWFPLKASEKPIFLTPWYAHVRVRIRGYEILGFLMFSWGSKRNIGKKTINSKKVPYSSLDLTMIITTKQPIKKFVLDMRLQI